jgi:hypothetical protein
VRQSYALALILLVAVGCGRSNYDQGYRDGYKQGLDHSFDARCAKATPWEEPCTKENPCTIEWVTGTHRDWYVKPPPTPTPAPVKYNPCDTEISEAWYDGYKTALATRFKEKP